MLNANNTIKDFSSLVSRVGIEIPLIQRDYVQGRVHDTEDLKQRLDEEARTLLKKYTDEREKRDKFVHALVEALHCPKTPAMQLTFIYGTVEDASATESRHPKSFVPLDGQQRLTTLFLLSWVLWIRADKEGLSEVAGYADFMKGMKSVSYKTRPSSGEFCACLVNEDLKELPGVTSLSDRLKNQSWFGDDWMLDPTVQAMLQMVDQIDSELIGYKPSDISLMFRNLVEGKGIEFELLDMKDYQLTDGLYIKMNARGKQLTKFENWKSEFIDFLGRHFGEITYQSARMPEGVFAPSNPTLKEYFEYSIEHQWTDLFWPYCVEKIAAAGEEDCYPVIDDYFMNSFYALHQLFYFREHRSTDVKEFQDTVAQREATFGNPKRVQELFDYLDLLKEFNDCGIYEKLFFVGNGNQYAHPEDKVRLFDGKGVNLLTRCAKGDDFTNIVQIVLYGMLRYANEFGTEVTPKFKAFIRQVRNIVEGVVGLRARDAAVVNTLQICDIYSINEKIEQLLNSCKAGNFPTVSSGYVEVDDLDFVCGNLKPDLLPKSAGAPVGYTAEQVAEVLKAWDAMKEYDKIALLVGYGYKGLYILTCANGEAYLLGNNDRWKTLFMRDESLKDPLMAIVSDYLKESASSGKKGTAVLDSLLLVKKNGSSANYDFTYYVLNYRDFLYSHGFGKLARQYFAFNGDRDALNISSIVYSSKPISSYYTNPVVFAVKAALCRAEKSDGRRKLFLWDSRYNTGAASLYIFDYKDQVGDPTAILSQLPGEHGKGGWKYLVKATGNVKPQPDDQAKDRIIAGVEFMKSLYPDCDFYEK